MNDTEDFDDYVEALPTMLTLLSDGVHAEPGPTSPSLLELRDALNAALAAAERLRLERRHRTRRTNPACNGAHLHLVT